MLVPALLAAALISAPPTEEAVKAVFDHFYSGSELVLADVVLCKEIEQEDKKRKYECNETFEEKAEVGATVYVYLTALVPRETTHEIMVQALHEGMVRTTKDLTMKGSKHVPRGRKFARFVASKPGTWQFTVRNEATVLKTVQLTVE